MDKRGKHDHLINEDEQSILWLAARKRVSETRLRAMLWISGMPTMHAAALWFLCSGFLAWTLIQALSRTLIIIGDEAFVWPARFVIAVGWFSIWVWWLAKAWRLFEAIKGVWLSLLMHPILLCQYVLGPWGLISGVFILGEGVWTQNVYYCGVGLGSLVISVVSFWIGARGMRYVATHCAYRQLRSFSFTYDAGMVEPTIEVRQAIRR
ncbi:MAG: hypothetical protein R3C45_06290 [Phycisphaerales bacterium]